MGPASSRDGDAHPPDPAEIAIREITSPSEFEACVTIQKDTWGQDFSDIVPVSMLQITRKMGGVVSGAFSRDGTLVGLVYGITGPKDGTLAHWSHMLAVRPEARNAGIGRRLKLHQRDLLRAMDVQVMYWTFDPLVARNAHLNLNRLGARVAEYVPDMYGASDSELHRLGTDRFIARWELDAPPPDPVGEPSQDHRPRLGPEFGRSNPPEPPDAPWIEVVIPQDIGEVEARSFEEAMGWRQSTRRAFRHYLGAGYHIASFVPGDDLAYYVLNRRDA